MTTKCQKGYRYQGGKCVRYVTKVRYKNTKVSDGIKSVKYLIIGLLIVLSFLFAINLRNSDVLWSLGFNIVILVISLLVYSSSEFKDNLIGIPKNNILKVVIWGCVFTFVFWVGTAIIPGLSLGYPTVVGDISASFKWFLINIISPLSESIFFLGVVFAFMDKITGKDKYIALTLTSILFALFHLSAYLIGFYQYPDFATAYGAFWANASSFFVAFLFNMIAGWFMLRKGIRNLVFAFVFHFGLNFIAYTFSIVVFALSLALL